MACRIRSSIAFHYNDKLGNRELEKALDEQIIHPDNRYSRVVFSTSPKYQRLVFSDTVLDRITARALGVPIKTGGAWGEEGFENFHKRLGYYIELAQAFVDGAGMILPAYLKHYGILRGGRR